MSPAARKPRSKAGDKPAHKKRAAARVTTARKEAAAKAAAEAKAAGAVGIRSTTGELLKGEKLVLRDAAIASHVAAGWRIEDAAKEFGVSARTARAVVQRSKAMSSPMDRTPMELVERLMRESERAALALQRLALKYENVNPSATVGAWKAAQEERRILADMLVEIGKMPRELEWFRTTAEVSHMVGELLERIERMERGELTGSDVAGYMREVVMGERPLYEGDVIDGVESEPTDGGDGEN